MQQLTPGALIDELRAALHVSEQRRHRAEGRLADRERALGSATAVIAALDQQIADLRAELGTLREAATPPTTNSVEVLLANGQLALINECGLPSEMGLKS
ncbi:hypothetical protein [Mycobacterium sp.]|jgi:hypothetical protein|uniref:hypothetical protein n=1 Tax=Mycobacterium sp. TaxID=1785 RepID=UPI003C776212